MTDDPTLTALRHRLTEVRDSLGDVHMTIPASEIFARDTRRRARHRLAAAVGTAAAAAVAVAVAVALPASHAAASHPASRPGAQLAAWTVTRQSDGTIQVSFFGELRDPAGLQRTLRADGVPASVTYIGQQNPACQAYPSPPSPSGFQGPLSKVVGGGGFYKNNPSQTALVIHPSALPHGAGLQIAVMRGIPPGPAGPWPYPKGSGHPEVEISLVKASMQCTGS
jgi:hypothetical protein